jgi:group I intron endonuclease
MTILYHAKRVYLSPLSEKKAIILENKGSAGVYALICKVSNKFYVGSSIKLTDRLLDYMQPAYLGQQTNRPILRAIVKYGLINLIFVILETCRVTDVLQREQYWLDLLEPEYNLSPTAGSTLGVTLSEETKAKMSAIKQGALHPQVPRSQCIVTGTGFGKSRSAETVALMRTNHPHTKRVYQYTSDKVTFVAVYDSIRQAAELTGISRGYLTRCLNQGILAHGKWFFSLSLVMDCPRPGLL